MIRRRLIPGKQLLVLGGVLLLLASAVYPAAARSSAWNVSTKNNIMLVSPGSQGIGGGSFAAISSQGRYVAFESFAPDLEPGQVGDSWDVFVSDIDNSQTRRVSTRTDGTPVYNPGEYTCAPAVAGSGRFVAFMSQASGLVTGDTNGMPDIFLRDRESNTTRPVSISVNGMPPNGPSFTPAVSADGRYVAFQSMASNLVNNDTNDAMDVFVRDMVRGVTRRVSVTSSGAEGTTPYEYPISSISISGDGRYIAFAYEGLPFPNLTPQPYIYIHDQQTRTTEVVAQGTYPNFSSDGRYLVFLSYDGLSESDENHYLDVYLLDRQSNSFERITTEESDAPMGQEILSAPDISDDGRYVVFESNGGFVSGELGQFHIYLRDRITSTTGQVDQSIDGTTVNGEAHSPAISDDGKTIAFTSTAANLVADDNNNASDVFVYLNTKTGAIAENFFYFFPMVFR